MNFDSRITTKTVTIADSQTVSGSVQLISLYDGTTLGLVGIMSAANFATADITFQFSLDDSTYIVPKTAAGGALQISQLAASDWRPLDPVDFLSAKWIKVVSSATQSGGDTLTLILRSLG